MIGVATSLVLLSYRLKGEGEVMGHNLAMLLMVVEVLIVVLGSTL